MEVFGKEQRCDGCDMMELTGTGAGVLSEDWPWALTLFLEILYAIQFHAEKWEQRNQKYESPCEY
jgi:hypothetical protein